LAMETFYTEFTNSPRRYGGTEKRNEENSE
jgi:hypothetical protein